jgi:uncharacterized protein (TIGR02145 family)
VKTKYCLIQLVFIVLVLLLISGCKREKVPTLSTLAVSEISPTTAKTGGRITSDGNVDIIVRGVCWSTRKSPTIDGTRTTDGYGTGEFQSTITLLIPNTTYYAKAYATNKIGTAYGNEVTFKTGSITVPAVTTTAVASITQTSAVSGGTVTSDGGVGVTQRGVCWATHSAPLITENSTNDGTGTGIFSSLISGLTGNTIYYVRAYATNSEGTGYGQEISFTTSPVVPVITTTDPAATSTTTGTGGGTVTSDGGSPVTARGVCWSTSSNPTTGNDKTSNGAGTGQFTSIITGLTVNTTYHVRAYATNSVGTGYGADKTFTSDPATITDRDGNVYDVIRIYTQLWIKQNLKTTKFSDGTLITQVTDNTAWSNLATQAYCWYNNDAATYKPLYGALYNWYAVSSGKLCPTGWHVPSDAEWLTLSTNLGGDVAAGGMLKEEGTLHWASPNTAATNETDFTALPGGYRTDTGQFDNFGTYGFWWTSTLNTGTSTSFYRKLQYDNSKLFRNLSDNKFGMSVRCMKN